MMNAKWKSNREKRRAREWKETLGALDAAVDYADTVAAVYAVVWFGKTNNPPPVADAVRCAGNLAAWFSKCPPVAVAEACQRAADMFDVDGDAVQLREVDGELRLCVSKDGGEGGDTEWRDVNRKRAKHHPHPLGPVVKAWQDENPALVKPKARTDPIFPLEFLRREEETEGRMLSPLDLTKSGAKQAKLFDLMPGDESMRHVYLPLKIMEAGLTEPGSSRVTPLPTRLWLESVFDANLLHGGRRQSVGYRLYDLMNILYPNEWKPSVHLPRLHVAIRKLNDMSLPMFIEGKWRDWFPVSVLALDLDIDDPHVYIEVRLPPGSERGVIMPRLELRRLAMQSSVMHRALMNLHFRFHAARKPVPGGRGRTDQWIQSETPEDYGDRLLTADGNPANPKAAAELMRIVFPYTMPLSPTRRHNPSVAGDAIMKLKEQGLVRIVDGRVMPPPARRGEKDTHGK